jgi:hypothetical protein
MRFKDEDFGAKIIETITSGLYDGNLNCLREYVQNSIDGHAKNIEIYFENGLENLVIKDDGDGMDQNKLMRSLSIGVSDKSGDDIGWRGIGIWSGVPACRRIVIITKARNNKKYRIVIYNDKLRDLVEGDQKATDVLSEITGDVEELPLGEGESFEDLHFATVRLESILSTQRTFFNEEEIPLYLEKTIPAPFDKSRFSKSEISFANKIDEELKKRKIIFPEVNVIFNRDTKIYRPPFRSDIFFDKIIFNEFEIKNKKIAFGWFVCTNQNRVLQAPNKGIYLKKKGFTIGDENLVIKQFKGIYNPWQYGEIHIISDKLKENASRNNFEFNNDIVTPFLDKIGEYVGQLQMLSRYQSDKIVERKITKINSSIEKEDIVSAKKEIQKAKESLVRPTASPKDKSLEEMKEHIDSISKKNKSEISSLEIKVKTIVPEKTSEKEKIQKIIDCLPQPYKDHYNKSKKNWLEPETNIMEPVIQLLKKKTGSNETGIPELSKIAFGWENITKFKDKPKLTITNGIRDFRDNCFGVMIFSMHELFVNPSKHEKGKMSFEWFESLSNDQKKEVMLGVYSTLGLIYRIIENSKFRQP